MNPVQVTRGDSPLILAQPHDGTYVPEGVMQRLNARGQELADTDWHIGRLYEGLVQDVTTVRATFHRYVIDANRDPKGDSLYPGQNTTTLCPFTDFEGEDIWLTDEAPEPDEIDQRCAQFHKPYHRALEAEIERVKKLNGFVILYDCHSIRSDLPFLFEGQLPIFNIGTNNLQTCAPIVQGSVLDVCAAATDFDHVVNGRFKGGWTTRHYGQPKNNVHAIQMELAQRAYMNECAPWAYRDDLAAQIQPHLTQILHNLQHLSLSQIQDH